MRRAPFYRASWAIIVLALSALAPALRAEGSSFCGPPQAPVKVSARLPILKAGNIPDFLATNRIARERSLTTYATIAERLLGIPDGPVGPGDIQPLFTFLMSMHDEMVASADQGIGQALADGFLSAVEDLYARNPVQLRRIRFSYGHPALADLDEAPLSYALYGQYSVVSGQQVRLTITVLRVDTQEQRSFSAIAPLTQVSAAVAQHFFDAFQRPELPEFVDPMPNKEWVPLPATLAVQDVLTTQAQAVCAAQGARLPTRLEMTLGAAFGPYFTGVGFDPSRYYAIEDAGELQVMNLYSSECLPPAPRQKAAVLCIRDLGR
jgi:hypothetical protein